MDRPRTLYVSDLDGTLLSSQTVISPRSRSIINRLIQTQGTLFSIATARTPATAVGLMEGIDTPLPFILMSGATMWDNRKQEFLNVRSIPRAVAGKLLAIFDSHGVCPFLYLQQGNHICTRHSERLTEAEYAFIHPRTTGTPYKRLQLVERLTADADDPIMLICSTGKFEVLNRVYKDILAAQLPCSAVCFRDVEHLELGYLEIHAQGTTKALALRRLAEQARAERIVVFGDNLNDIPMMQEADHAVCVANAFDDVKRVADEITLSNDEDAVALWIERDVLQAKN